MFSRPNPRNANSSRAAGLSGRFSTVVVNLLQTLPLKKMDFPSFWTAPTPSISVGGVRSDRQGAPQSHPGMFQEEFKVLIVNCFSGLGLRVPDVRSRDTRGKLQKWKRACLGSAGVCLDFIFLIKIKYLFSRWRSLEFTQTGKPAPERRKGDGWGDKMWITRLMVKKI